MFGEYLGKEYVEGKEIVRVMWEVGVGEIRGKDLWVGMFVFGRMFYSEIKI